MKTHPITGTVTKAEVEKQLNEFNVALFRLKQYDKYIMCSLFTYYVLQHMPLPLASSVGTLSVPFGLQQYGERYKHTEEYQAKLSKLIESYKSLRENSVLHDQDLEDKVLATILPFIKSPAEIEVIKDNAADNPDQKKAWLPWLTSTANSIYNGQQTEHKPLRFVPLAQRPAQQQLDMLLYGNWKIRDLAPWSKQKVEEALPDVTNHVLKLRVK